MPSLLGSKAQILLFTFGKVKTLKYRLVNMDKELAYKEKYRIEYRINLNFNGRYNILGDSEKIIDLIGKNKNTFTFESGYDSPRIEDDHLLMGAIFMGDEAKVKNHFKEIQEQLFQLFNFYPEMVLSITRTMFHSVDKRFEEDLK